MAINQPFLQTQLRDLVTIDRACSDLRRGLPVIVSDRACTYVIYPAALADPDSLERLRLFGPPELLISRERAAILKIRHKGLNAIRLSCPTWLKAYDIRAIADPTLDLSAPLKGPFSTPDATDEAQSSINEATLKLLKIARLLPAAVIITPDNAQAGQIAQFHGLLTVKKASIDAYDTNTHAHLQKLAEARLPLEGAENCRIAAFRSPNGGQEHFAIIVGNPAPSDPVLVRLHSECFTGDALGSLKCDCGNQFKGALNAIAKQGSGILLYLAQEGRGIGLVAKLKAYALQDQGYDTVDANLRLGFATDERHFGPAAAMLHQLGFTTIRLLTNNPEKVAGLEAEGITVTERVAHHFPANPHNAHYLATKRDKTGHFL